MQTLSQWLRESFGLQLVKIRSEGRLDGYNELTGMLDNGNSVVARYAQDPSNKVAAMFAAEANGLAWLAEAAGGPPVPRVHGVAAEFLVIEFPEPQEAESRAVARRFGADLARMHTAGAPSFGAPWPGFIESLPLDNTAGTDWGSWYAERRLVPYLRMAHDEGKLEPADVSLVETVIDRIGELAGPPEPPSRIHGRLWWDYLWCSGSRGYLIDPAAHGGHRETDLATLVLFYPRYRDEIVEAYEETIPLAHDWSSRLPLHELHPVLVHVCLGYGVPTPWDSVADVARAALAGEPG